MILSQPFLAWESKHLFKKGTLGPTIHFLTNCFRTFFLSLKAKKFLKEMAHAVGVKTPRFVKRWRQRLWWNRPNCFCRQRIICLVTFRRCFRLEFWIFVPVSFRGFASTFVFSPSKTGRSISPIVSCYTRKGIQFLQELHIMMGWGPRCKWFIFGCSCQNRGSIFSQIRRQIMSHNFPFSHLVKAIFERISFASAEPTLCEQLMLLSRNIPIRHSHNFNYSYHFSFIDPRSRN